MKRHLILFVGILTALTAGGHLLASGIGKGNRSGPQSDVVVQPVATSDGNTRRPISVKMSTTAAVLISSAPENASIHETWNSTQTFESWRVRTIVNCSTYGALILLPDNTYNSFSSTFSIVLGTGPFGQGDSYTTYDQAEIWGVWDGRSTGGATFPLAGACGEEQFYIQRAP